MCSPVGKRGRRVASGGRWGREGGEGFSEEVPLRPKRPQWTEGLGAERAARAKAPGQERARRVGGTARRPVWPAQSKRAGPREGRREGPGPPRRALWASGGLGFYSRSTREPRRTISRGGPPPSAHVGPPARL